MTRAAESRPKPEAAAVIEAISRPQPHLLRRQVVARDGEQQRNEARPDSLHDATDDQRGDVPGERSADGTQEEDHKAAHEQPPLSVLVAEPAGERHRDRRGEEIAAHDPGGPRDGGVELVAQSRESRHHGGLLDRYEQRDEEERPEPTPIYLPRGIR